MSTNIDDILTHLNYSRYVHCSFCLVLLIMRPS